MKVLVADFDGTFFTDEFENDIERVNKFVDNGNIFIIATGRSLESLHEKIKNYNIKYSYLICSDGAVIYDKNLVKIYHIDLDKELALKIVEQLNNDKNIREVFVSNGCKLLENSEQINSILGRHIKKRLAFNSLKKITSNFSNVHGYISTNWVVINDLKASKGNAIKYLIDKHNFDQKKFLL